MNVNMRCKRSGSYRISKLFFIYVFVLLIPINYLGNPIKANNVANNPLAKDCHTNLPISSQSREALQKDQADQSYFDANIVFSTWISVILVLSSFLLLLILRYLSSLPLNKECLLLYLYRDVLRLIFLKTWSEVGLAVLYKANGNIINEANAKFTSYLPFALSLGLLLMLNACSFLKLWMAKSRVLDPLVVHYEYDDETAIKIIRCLISFLVIAFVGMLYFNEIYHPLYYYLHALPKSPIDLPTGALMLRLVHMILMFTYVILHIVSLFYDHVDDCNNCRICRFLGNRQACREDHDVKNNGGLSRTNHMFVPIVWVPVLLLFLGVILLTLMEIVPFSNPSVRCLFMATVSGIVLPTMIIWYSHQLKECVKRNIIQSTAPVLRCLEVALTSLVWIRRSTRIMPRV